MRITVIGAGAMGSLFGGLLASVADVCLLDPWLAHVDAICRDGLRINEPDGERVVRVPATTAVSDVAPTDLAIIFVKSSQTPWAADVAQAVLKPDGLAMTLQNGVGNRDTLAAALGAGRAWQGVTAHGATMLGPGHIRHAGTGPTHLETRADIAERAEDVAGLFNRAGLETHLSPDLDSLIWGKLVINVGINALTAILRVPNGVLAEHEATRAVMAQAVDEAMAVVAAKGITLAYPDAQAKVLDVARATGGNRSSMLQDVLRGSATEIDVINAAVVRSAAGLGLAAPVNQTLTNLVKAIEATAGARL